MKIHYELVQFGEVIKRGDVMWVVLLGETLTAAIKSGYQATCISIGLPNRHIDGCRWLRPTNNVPAGATVAQDADSCAVAVAGGATEGSKVDPWANLSPERLKSKIWAIWGELDEARLAGSPSVVLEVLGDLTHAYRLLELQWIQRQQERFGGAK